MLDFHQLVALQFALLVRWLAPAARQDHMFLSYRRNEMPEAWGYIYDALVARFGRARVVRDLDSFPLGVDVRAHIADAMSRCAILIVIIGPDWVTGASRGKKRPLLNPNDYVRLEIELAFARGLRVVPVLVGGVRLPSKGVLPKPLKPLAELNAIELRGGTEFRHDLDRLMAGLTRH